MSGCGYIVSTSDNYQFLKGMRNLVDKSGYKLTICYEYENRGDRWMQVGVAGSHFLSGFSFMKEFNVVSDHTYTVSQMFTEITFEFKSMKPFLFPSMNITTVFANHKHLIVEPSASFFSEQEMTSHDKLQVS